MVGFFLAIYVGEAAMLRCKMSPILGSLLCGILLGPSFLDIVNFDLALRFFGKIGLMLLVAESGMEVDLESVRRSGCRAFLAATIGVVMPVAFSVTILVPIFGSNIREALAAGSAIAPTSLGFTASLL